MNYGNHYKIDLQHFTSANNFFIIFFTYIKMSAEPSAKYYQNNKGRLQKNTSERYQSLSKKEKEKKG